MAFDYKKEYKEFYMPKSKPSIIKIPKMNYIAVRGKGDPNDENGEYKKTIGLLYGICVQCMHIGSYDNEPDTIKMMKDYAEKNGYEINITDTRFHHEIYLSDPRRCDVSKLKTIIRHPVAKKEV
ncbi:MAG: GyrI-like domain-containing protein [Clostridia bacterium]|nr:GyrI-like domain-containing protein [Clostridia bacterium]